MELLKKRENKPKQGSRILKKLLTVNLFDSLEYGMHEVVQFITCNTHSFVFSFRLKTCRSCMRSKVISQK